jgi:hypothetical protein
MLATASCGTEIFDASANLRTVTLGRVVVMVTGG